MKITIIALFSLALLPFLVGAKKKSSPLQRSAEATMLRATEFMVETVSTSGGYLWYYLPDFSRRWGEMEAFKTMIWIQHPGTVSMGHVFLNAYRITEDEYYYQAAEKAAAALIWGQSHDGGWNYMIDFAGDRSLKHWYDTIGKNGWRLEEFQHYYGNSTYDDDVTSNAARFLLRIYLEKLDPKYKPALDKAIGFILKSQYPNGAWPQRYPLKHDYRKNGTPDYTSYYTFNDDVTWENVHFLVQCYLVLGEERFLEPIHRGMDFYLASLDSSGAWALQLDSDLKPAKARTYEPAAFTPSTTCDNALLLLKFYEYTGETRFIEPVPRIIEWLEMTKLPPEMIEGSNTHPMFVELGTNKPLFVHRIGSNVKYGSYYVNYDDKPMLGHYRGKRRIELEKLKSEYARISNLSPKEATRNSPLKAAPFTRDEPPQSYYDLNQRENRSNPSETDIRSIINSLDTENRWLSKHAYISNPYIGDGEKQEQTEKYSSTRVGDETDTSPFQDESDQAYISTRMYINNMQSLIKYVEKIKYPDGFEKSALWY